MMLSQKAAEHLRRSIKTASEANDLTAALAAVVDSLRVILADSDSQTQLAQREFPASSHHA